MACGRGFGCQWLTIYFFEVVDKLSCAQQAIGLSMAPYRIRLMVFDFVRQIRPPVTDSIQHGFGPRQVVILSADVDIRELQCVASWP